MNWDSKSRHEVSTFWVPVQKAVILKSGSNSGRVQNCGLE